MQMSRRDFIKKSGAVPLIGLTAGVAGALVSGDVGADPALVNYASPSTGATATATSFAWGNFVATSAITPPFNTRSWTDGACWASAGTPTKSAPQSLTVRLGAPAGAVIAVRKLCIYSVQNNYINPDPNPYDFGEYAGTPYTPANYFAIKDFTVEAWDGLSWQIVATVTNNDHAKLTIIFSTIVYTDKFRIQVTGTQSGTTIAMITGFEAWGYIDNPNLTNLYNVISTTPLGVSGMLQQYSGLSAANAAASAQSAYNNAIYGGGVLGVPTLSVQPVTRPRLVDSNFHAQDITYDDVFGNGAAGGGGGIFGFDFVPSSGYTNHDFITINESLSLIEKNQVDYQMRLLIMGGALTALLGSFLTMPAMVGYGAAISGVGILGLGRDAFTGTDTSIVPNAEGGFGIYHKFSL